MKTYIVVDSNVLNPDKLAEYSNLAAQTVNAYEGKFIFKGESKSLHGGQSFAKKALIEFPSEQLASDWYHSEEYQALIELRDQAMESQFQLLTAET